MISSIVTITGLETLCTLIVIQYGLMGYCDKPCELCSEFKYISQCVTYRTIMYSDATSHGLLSAILFCQVEVYMLKIFYHMDMI